MTQGLAWPVVVLVLGFVFRKQIQALLSRPMEHVEVGPIRATWAHVMAEVKATVEEMPVTAKPPDTEKAQANIGERMKAVTLKQLVRTDPGTAVLIAHDLIYRQLQEMTGQDFGISTTLPKTPFSLARDARARGLISDETLNAIMGMSRLRNIVAHGGADQVTPDRAQEYVAQVEPILWVLSNTRPSGQKLT